METDVDWCVGWTVQNKESKRGRRYGVLCWAVDSSTIPGYMNRKRGTILHAATVFL